MDVTLEAWKIVSLATAIAAVKDGKTRFTFTQLADIVRGVKTDGVVLVDGSDVGGYVGIDKKLRLNLEATCGGPAFLTKDVSATAFQYGSALWLTTGIADQQTESLVMQLYLEAYLDVGELWVLLEI